MPILSSLPHSPLISRGSYWKLRSVFITGAAGFVGSWLCEELSRLGARVTALVLPGHEKPLLGSLSSTGNVETVIGCVEDTDFITRTLQRANTETVFHLAAINANIGTTISPTSIFETNIRGTWSILEACRMTPSVGSVVIASSREAEDSRSAFHSEVASVSRRKRHPYQVSKISAEIISQAYFDTYNIPVVISRSDNIYGGRDLNWNRLIPGTVRSLLSSEAPFLRSDGTLTRDYVYIKDIVNAYLMLASRATEPGIRGEVFHFATGVNTSALEIVNLLCELTGRYDLKPVILNQSTGERVNQDVLTVRDRNLLGWTSRVGIRYGLQSTVNWYRNYFDSK